MLRCACGMQNGHGGLPRERLFSRQLGLSALSALSVASIELAFQLFHEFFCLAHAREPFHAALLLARQPLAQAPCARARK
eukprot:414029-Pleurochrysis_carterae.AAC.1